MHILLLGNVPRGTDRLTGDTVAALGATSVPILGLEKNLGFNRKK